MTNKVQLNSPNEPCTPHASLKIIPDRLRIQVSSEFNRLAISEYDKLNSKLSDQWLPLRTSLAE
jgi:hypothetical protein